MWLHHRHCTCLGCSSRFLCVCASFEMDLIWIFMVGFFPVRIPASTCVRCWGLVCGFVVCWGNYHMSLNTWMCYFTSAFVMFFTLRVFLSKTVTYAALPYMLIAVCRSVRHPTGGVCINAVICKWHALETSVLSGRIASDVHCLCTQQMQIIKTDQCAGIFM